MSTVIEVSNLSKIYHLGEISTGTISRDLERFVKTKIFKQEDPFLKIGETNNTLEKGASDIVYSLKNINFDIEQGSAVGIIGRNGAGKSTLLKVLSRVTSPTTGKINLKGRVASLLEVGTGFHPELTGRENIFLNGAILGMRKNEIKRKFDEIVDFSGVERYIDTPVKRYSSGMYVRLAFAVAAHLESEILIVDEVLAVGDAEFQKKCLGKMGEVSKGEGRTVLFVSHNMDSISKLCANSILLSKGALQSFDNSNKVINSYLNNHLKQRKGQLIIDSIDSISHKIKLLEVRVNGNAYSEVHLKENQNLIIEYVITSLHDINVIPFASVYSDMSELIFISSILIDGSNKTYPIASNKETNIRHEISIPNLNSGQFYLSFGLADPGFEEYVSFDKTVILICQSQYSTNLNGYFNSNSKVEITLNK
jgi:lipopolysaccharide transport system ATP-binding protein